MATIHKHTIDLTFLIKWLDTPSLVGSISQLSSTLCILSQVLESESPIEFIPIGYYARSDL